MIEVKVAAIPAVKAASSMLTARVVTENLIRLAWLVFRDGVPTLY